jgi:hypothetical protein
MLFRYIGSDWLNRLCNKVSLQVTQSDGSKLFIDNISKGDVIEINDVLAIRYIELDEKYEKCE